MTSAPRPGAPAVTTDGRLPHGPIVARSIEPAASRDELADAEPLEESLEEPEPIHEPETVDEPEPVDEPDEDVHFDVAAKRLGVSRKTVERMVKRGELQRGPSGHRARVSSRALADALERRPETSDGADDLERLGRAQLQPWLQELVARETRAALAEYDADRRAQDADRDRERDELLLVLATGSRRQRSRARKYVLWHLLDELEERVEADQAEDEPGA